MGLSSLPLGFASYDAPRFCRQAITLMAQDARTECLLKGKILPLQKFADCCGRYLADLFRYLPLLPLHATNHEPTRFLIEDYLLPLPHWQRRDEPSPRTHVGTLPCSLFRANRLHDFDYFPVAVLFCRRSAVLPRTEFSVFALAD